MKEMKRISYLAAALTVLAGAASCDKNTEIAQSQQQTGEYRQVTITAGPTQTKTSVSGGTLTWSTNDKLNIVPQSGSVAAAALNIKSGVGTASGTFKGQIDASITDETELYGWCSGDWSYTSGAFSVTMPAIQTYVANGLAENAYPSIGTGSITSGISLSNPMGVLKLSVQGAAADDKVTSITVTSAATNLSGSFSVNKSTYAVSGGSSKTVTLNVASPYATLSLTDAVNFYIVVPPAEYAAGDLSVNITFSDDSYLSTTFTDAVTVTAGNATAKEISDHTGRRGTLNSQDWVMIRAKYDGTNNSHLKWATQNLAVTTSGKAKWNSTDYVTGDYFQWAAYDGYVTGTNPENLVIYTSFTVDFGGCASFNNSWKDGKSFQYAFTPYTNNDSDESFNKYTGSNGDKKTTLEQSDDVANIVLGSTWRIPTTGESAGEFNNMISATYWAWDATDLGYYVFKSGVGTTGTAGSHGFIGTGDDKTNALLFFPAAGYGLDSDLTSPGENGRYWSSSLHEDEWDNITKKAGNLDFYVYGSDCYCFEGNNRSFRHHGFSVRPVSN